MKIAIFAKERLAGNRFLTSLIGDMKYRDVKSFTNNGSICRAVLTDETEYRVLPSNDSMRGHKFQKAYVSLSVPTSFVTTTILSSFYLPDSVGVDIEYFNE